MALNTGWTKEESDQLVKLWATGLSASKCGAKMGRTRGSIVGRVKRMGLTDHGEVIIRRPRKKKPPEDKMVILDFPKAPIDQKNFNPEKHTPMKDEELNKNSCRWPFSDEDGNHLGYCGCNKSEYSYCDYHAAIAYPALRDLKKQKQEEVA